MAILIAEKKFILSEFYFSQTRSYIGQIKIINAKIYFFDIFSTVVGLDSQVVIAIRPIGQMFASKFTQKVLGKLTKCYGVVITIKNRVTKK